MKNYKGETLEQPYLDLARMRREEQIDTKFVNDGKALFAQFQLLKYAFIWESTPEMDFFWDAVYKGLTPAIPESSQRELEAWRAKQPKTEYDFMKELYDRIQTSEPDYKAMYFQSQMERGYYKDLYESKCIELDAIQESVTPTRNWIAECAMAIMAELSIDVMLDSYVYTRSWERAEAWAAKGKKRGHI